MGAAGSAKLVKARTEGNWTGAGVVESLPLGDQEKGRNILLPENAYDLSGSVQAVYVGRIKGKYGTRCRQRRSVQFSGISQFSARVGFPNRGE